MQEQRGVHFKSYTCHYYYTTTTTLLQLYLMEHDSRDARQECMERENLLFCHAFMGKKSESAHRRYIKKLNLKNNFYKNKNSLQHSIFLNITLMYYHISISSISQGRSSNNRVGSNMSNGVSYRSSGLSHHKSLRYWRSCNRNILIKRRWLILKNPSI